MKKRGEIEEAREKDKAMEVIYKGEKEREWNKLELDILIFVIRMIWELLTSHIDMCEDECMHTHTQTFRSNSVLCTFNL